LLRTLLFAMAVGKAFVAGSSVVEHVDSKAAAGGRAGGRFLLARHDVGFCRDRTHTGGSKEKMVY
jgi:hypothetical protein